MICLSDKGPSRLTGPAHLKYDVLTVLRLEPAVLRLQLLLPPTHRALGYLQQNRVGQLLGLHLLLQLKIDYNFTLA